MFVAVAFHRSSLFSSRANLFLCCIVTLTQKKCWPFSVQPSVVNSREQFLNFVCSRQIGVSGQFQFKNEIQVCLSLFMEHFISSFSLLNSILFFYNTAICISFFSLWTVTKWDLYSLVLLVANFCDESSHSLHSYRKRPGCLLLLMTCFRRFSYEYKTQK